MKNNRDNFTFKSLTYSGISSDKLAPFKTINSLGKLTIDQKLIRIIN